MIEIGGYILDVNEMTLSREGSSVKLEPKVLEVLSYFRENEIKNSLQYPPWSTERDHRSRGKRA